MSLAGRRAVVTGGANGIGRAVALALSRCGAETWVLDSDDSALEALADTDLIHTLAADFAAEAGEDIAKRLIAAAGCPDLIVNNVGTITSHNTLTVSAADWMRVLTVNLTAPFFFSQHLISQLIQEKREGSVLMISSLHARRVRGAPHYSASKAGLEMAALELANDVAAHRIRVNVVRPGWIETALGDIDESERDRAERVIPQGRRGTPDDLVGVALALLDPEVSGYVTGACVRIDGGLDLYSWS
jgi:NAD(P)-dependent dehydrogenase (short-subunit alcohol dehydrogenase family)